MTAPYRVSTQGVKSSIPLLSVPLPWGYTFPLRHKYHQGNKGFLPAKEGAPSLHHLWSGGSQQFSTPKTRGQCFSIRMWIPDLGDFTCSLLILSWRYCHYRAAPRQLSDERIILQWKSGGYFSPTPASLTRTEKRD